MIADKFHPIFILTILTCFIQKNCSGALRPHLHQGMDPWELIASTTQPAAIVFGFVKNRCAHIFSVLLPGTFYFTPWNIFSKVDQTCWHDQKYKLEITHNKIKWNRHISCYLRLMTQKSDTANSRKNKHTYTCHQEYDITCYLCQ